MDIQCVTCVVYNLKHVYQMKHWLSALTMCYGNLYTESMQILLDRRAKETKTNKISWYELRTNTQLMDN